MLKDKQEIFQSLLNIHKVLLEQQKTEYEKVYGVISNTNQYFQLVVSHENFTWLRQLSALLASFDEILESDNQDIEAVVKEIILLLSGEGSEDFYQHLKIIIDNNPMIAKLIGVVIESLKNPA